MKSSLFSNTLLGICLSLLSSFTFAQYSEGVEIDPPPSGNPSYIDAYVSPDSTVVHPGKDTGTTDGNYVDFDSPISIPNNLDETTIIYDTEGDAP